MSPRARPARPPAPREAEIQKVILAVLRSLGVACWRANTGTFRAEYKGRSRVIRCGVKGQSDVLGILPGTGRFLAVEVKRPGNRPTTDQVSFLRSVNTEGGFAFWADAPAQVEEAVRAVLERPSLRVEVADDGVQYLTDEGVTS